jgi:TRAP-type C4-dicarboxylate transport system substrate-binding protein
MTEHAITIRPLCFSVQTMARLPRELQEAIRRAGREAAAFGRQTESSEDSQKITALEQAGRLRRVAFTERAQMNAAVQPVMAAYAREIDAEGIHNRIASMTS